MTRSPVDPTGLPATLGELRASGWVSRTVKEELRANLLARLAEGRPIVSGIVGYDDTVLPALENAIVAGQDLVLLGERGQAKTRLARLLVGLLDEHLPVVRGGELNDDPSAPISPTGKAIVDEHGDDTPIDWLPRDRRYSEKLATPDITIADLIGEVDPIRVAEGRYLSDELTLHYGLIPRSNRGIFAINELPDLAERIQVGLLNILEERDVQIRGFTVRLPLDLFVVASANPEDYTSRGRIVTPLKDRFDAQIRTHYPRDVETEIAIVEQEVAAAERDGTPVRVPEFMKTIVAQLTFEARAAGDINQGSGVSVRVSINNYETLIANAERRALLLGENEIVPRISDLHAVSASMLGKLEFEYTGEERSEQEAFERLLNRAVLAVFDRTVEAAELAEIVGYFEAGWGVEVSDRMPAVEYLEGIGAIPGLRDAIAGLGPFESPALMAAATEFILEGLHLHQKLNKEVSGGRVTYRV